jgi:hypothetical protein
MKKKMLLALFGLAAALTLASPTKASAGVVVGVRVGPVYARPAYGYVVAPRPYVYPPVYAAGYVCPVWGRGYRREGRWYGRPYAYRGYVGAHRFYRR